MPASLTKPLHASDSATSNLNERLLDAERGPDLGGAGRPPCTRPPVLAASALLVVFLVTAAVVSTRLDPAVAPAQTRQASLQLAADGPAADRVECGCPRQWECQNLASFGLLADCYNSSRGFVQVSLWWGVVRQLSFRNGSVAQRWSADPPGGVACSMLPDVYFVLNCERTLAYTGPVVVTVMTAYGPVHAELAPGTKDNWNASQVYAVQQELHDVHDRESALGRDLSKLSAQVQHNVSTLSSDVGEVRRTVREHNRSTGEHLRRLDSNVSDLQDHQRSTGGQIRSLDSRVSTLQRQVDALPRQSQGCRVCSSCGGEYPVEGGSIASVGFAVSEGDCYVTADNCVRSPGYPDNYGRNQHCVILAPRAGLRVEHFESFKNYDKLMVNGHWYSGHGIDAGPHLVVPATPLYWQSGPDPDKDTYTGWQICSYETLRGERCGFWRGDEGASNGQLCCAA